MILFMPTHGVKTGKDVRAPGRVRFVALVAYLFCAALVSGGCNAYVRGNQELSVENWDAAAAHYDQHLADEPGDVRARIRKGYALYEAGNTEEAKSIFESLLAADDRDRYALFWLGLIALRQGDRDQALAYLERHSTTDFEISVEVWRQVEEMKDQPSWSGPAAAEAIKEKVFEAVARQHIADRAGSQFLGRGDDGGPSLPPVESRRQRPYIP